MTTTTRNNEIIDTTIKAKQSTWSKPRKYSALIKSKFLRWLLCVNDEMLDEIEQECAVRDAIREQMIVHHEGSGRDAITKSMRDVYDTLGYDMSNFKSDENKAPMEFTEEQQLQHTVAAFDGFVFGDLPPVKADGVVHMSQVTSVECASFGDLPVAMVGDELCQSIDDPTLNQAQSEDWVFGGSLVVEGSQCLAEQSTVVEVGVTRTASVVPRFAAAVVLALRAKMGKLLPSEANRLLIEREYLKVCRDVNVRNVDIVMHQQFVINAFFTEGINDQLATTRVRLPKWLREAFGTVPNAEPTIC